MQYTYSTRYGDRSTVETRRRKRDRHGDEIPWQSEHDKAVDKGLVQVMKEDTLSFDKLLKVLRKETAAAMHSTDKRRKSAYERLDTYQGPMYACADGTPMPEALRWYWYDHLGVAHTRHEV